jgi:putative tryptophan/tyrosine transport system substrate-binding protein
MPFDQLHRREFVTLFGGAAAAAWPLVASAQQSATPVIGYLHSGAPVPFAHLVAVFLQGLKDSGYVEGQNVAIEYRWANGEYGRLSALTSDLVQRQVAVIVTAGGVVSALAAKKATATIPIVFTVGDDPVRLGLVTSLNRPGGNVTGVSVIIGVLDSKKLGLLREIVPNTAIIGILENPTIPSIQDRLSSVQQAARIIGQQIQILYASDERSLERMFSGLGQSGVGALVVGADPFFNSRREQIVALAAQYAIPAIYESRDYVIAGGLMSYGTDLSEGYRQVGLYTGRILKGEKAGDLPVVQSTKFELVINMKTANALGLAVPNSMQLLADEVIE